jgi:hypothetical protein
VLYFFSLSGIRYGVGAVPDLFTASIIPAKGAITSLKVLSFEKRTSLFNYGFRALLGPMPIALIKSRTSAYF